PQDADHEPLARMTLRAPTARSLHGGKPGFPRGPPRWVDARPAQLMLRRAKPASAKRAKLAHVSALGLPRNRPVAGVMRLKAVTIDDSQLPALNGGDRMNDKPKWQ